MMKRIISILSVLTFLLAFNSNAFAQTITASANVIKEISYAVTNEVDFGNVPADLTSTPSIDPTDGTGSNLIGTPSVARINISGNSTEEIIVSFDSQITLSETSDHDSDGQSDQLTYTPAVSGQTDNLTTASGGALLTPAEASGTSTISEINLTNGAYTLWFGGDLASGSTGSNGTLAAGAYEGTFTITVNYAF